MDYHSLDLYDVGRCSPLLYESKQWIGDKVGGNLAGSGGGGVPTCPM